jgi:O-methyltransferase involved in polyketide biosynthesis
MPAPEPARRDPPAHESAQPSRGVDIASQWMDELDLETLRFAVSPALPKRVAVDLGCGLGTQGVRLAMLGLQTFLYDAADIGERIERVGATLGIRTLHFRCIDLKHATPEDFPAEIGVVYSQRFMHYLRFDEACQLLDMLARRLASGARAFVSASGLNSELGAGYLDAGQPIEHRFAPIAGAMQAKHEVREPVCLYTREELEHMMVHHGFTAVRTWSSPFGNAKGVFQRV